MTTKLSVKCSDVKIRLRLVPLDLPNAKPIGVSITVHLACD